jgi:hypothetical protein
LPFLQMPEHVRSAVVFALDRTALSPRATRSSNTRALRHGELPHWAHNPSSTDWWTKTEAQYIAFIVFSPR